MAAQGGIRDNILQVSMPFEKGINSTRKSKAILPKMRRIFGNVSGPWVVVLKVLLWAAELREGRVRSCAEIAKREGITRARVSHLWPLSQSTREPADEAQLGGMGREISLRKLIRIARNPDAK